MFRNSIAETALTTQIANDFFQNIYGNLVFGEDTTFISTLRALMHPRMKPEDSIHFRFYNHNQPASRIGRNSAASTMAGIFDGTQMRDTTLLFNFGHYDKEENSKWMDFVEKNFIECNEGWVRVDVTGFFQQKFRCLAYINAEIRGVAIFTAGLNHRYLHFLQCATPLFFPWYFDLKADKVSPVEMELLYSLKEKDSGKYEDCCSRIASQYDMRTGRIMKLLGDFDKKFDNARLKQTNEEILSIEERINSYSDEINKLLKQRDEKNIVALGLMSKIASDDMGSGIADYFIANKTLSLREVNDDRFTFVVSDYIDYYDEDAAEKFISNQRGVLYQMDGTPEIAKEDMMELMRSIFIDQTLRMRVCGAFTIYLHGDVDSMSGYRYGGECNTFTPNPHIDRYNCLGNNKRLIQERLKNHDYIGAVDQCIAAAKSLNFYDGAVISEFARRMYRGGGGVNITCIELPDGKVVNPKAAIAWLKEQEAPKPAETPAEMQEQEEHDE